MKLPDFLQLLPYSLSRQEKSAYLLPMLNQLTAGHYENCHAYKKIMDLFQKNRLARNLEEVPYLPINLLKEMELASVPPHEVFKILHSSGTTGGQPSTVILDRETAQLQTAALANIMRDYLGENRRPMLIMDSESVIKNPKEFSARGAAIVGMAGFGRDHFYLFDENMEPRSEKLTEWLAKHAQEELFAFGFTYIIWKHVLAGRKVLPYDLSKAILFHSGGWKKLESEKVLPNDFRARLKEAANISKSCNFYGLVEQVGNIFVECENGVFHCPNSAEIIVRNPKSWEPAGIGEEGVIQLLSVLPKSYPGHSLLTEDLGVILSIDSCSCGRKGKAFRVLGRIPKAEPRGCGDTYAIS